MTYLFFYSKLFKAVNQFFSEVFPSMWLCKSDSRWEIVSGVNIYICWTYLLDEIKYKWLEMVINDSLYGNTKEWDNIQWCPTVYT